MVGGQRVNLPEGSQRVGTQEVVEADVLVSSDVDHLERRFGVRGKPGKRLDSALLNWRVTALWGAALF